jgi:hypothetical protein
MKKLLLLLLFATCYLPALFAQVDLDAPQDFIANTVTFPLQNPPQRVDISRVSVQLLDNPGPAPYCYWIVSNFTIGNSSPAGPVCVSNGPNTMVNGNRVSWSPVFGANTFDVLRTSTPTPPSGACNCAIATALNGISATDTGLNAYTVNTFAPAAFNLIWNNEQSASGQSQLVLRANGVQIFAINSVGAATALFLNGDPLTTNPTDQFSNPTTAVLGIGDKVAVNFGASTCCDNNLIVGLNKTGGNYKQGEVALDGETSCTGTFNQSTVCESITGQTVVYGTISTPVGSQQGTITGSEFNGAITATGGGQFQLGSAIVAGFTVFSGNTNFMYLADYFAQPAVNSGTGTVTGAFGAIFQSQSVGTVNYGIWNQGNHLICSGCGFYSLLAPTTTTSASMTGCPGACVAHVVDTAHGYSTGDKILNNSLNQQYAGFYTITVDDANDFHYSAIPQASNAANDGSTTINKIFTAGALMALDGVNEYVIRFPLNSAVNGAFQLVRGDGSVVLSYNSPALIVDPGNVGHILQLSTTGGFKFGSGGVAETGITGTGNNVVTDTGATIKTPTIQEAALLISPTAPTIAGAGCGGSAATILSNNGTASFTINTGTAPTTACTVTMPAAATDWNCYATDYTTNSTSVFLQKQTNAISTTSVTITNFNDVAVATNFVANDKVRVSCFAQ